MIGICGNATVGKDTLFTILKSLLSNKINCQRFALADDLKLEINDFAIKNYGISSFTKDSKEKELIRPFMVFHGGVKRKQSKGQYWTSLLQPKINLSKQNNEFPIITDIRYFEYDQDEVPWIKKDNNGILIHITRFDEFNNPIEPANSDEQRNELRLQQAADFKLAWPTNSNFDILKDIVKTQLKDLLKKYE